MNKKKKTTQRKHRKNKERIRKILQASLLKAKPKKVIITPKVESPIDTEVKVSKKTAAKKTSTKKSATKK